MSQKSYVIMGSWCSAPEGDSQILEDLAVWQGEQTRKIVYHIRKHSAQTLDIAIRLLPRQPQDIKSQQ